MEIDLQLHQAVLRALRALGRNDVAVALDTAWKNAIKNREVSLDKPEELSEHRRA